MARSSQSHVTHMLKREKLRLDKGQSSRFEQGTAAFLKKLKASWQDSSLRIQRPDRAAGPIQKIDR